LSSIGSALIASAMIFATPTMTTAGKTAASSRHFVPSSLR
jgi:hypothetical protein